MLLTEASNLILHKDAIRGIDRRERAPIVLEVSPFACTLLDLKVDGTLPGQQCRVGPGGTIEHSRRISGRGHRAEVALELVALHILRLVDLQQQVRRRAHDVAFWPC